MKIFLMLFLLAVIPFVSCKKNKTVFIPNQGCITGIDYFSMAHSEFGHVNSTQAYSHNVSVLAVPYHENNEDLRLVCYFGIEYETYVMSVVIKEGIVPGTYSLEESIDSLYFNYGYHTVEAEEFTVVIDEIEDLGECNTVLSPCYKKVSGRYTGIFYNADDDGTSKIAGEFCSNK